jgi:hypothetical protein
MFCRPATLISRRLETWLPETWLPTNRPFTKPIGPPRNKNSPKAHRKKLKKSQVALNARRPLRDQYAWER